MTLWGTNNPGLGGIDELTSAEEVIVASIASLGTSGQVLAVNSGEDGVEWVDQTGGGGGSAIILDLGDDGANESVDLSEIAVTNDTNSIFTEPTADKLLIDVSQNWPTADNANALATSALDAITEISASLRSGSDTTLITGTSGTDGDLAVWNIDGDLVDGPTPPTGTIVGTSDTQTLTNKTIDADSNTLSNLDIGNEVDWAAAADVADRSAAPATGDKLLLFEAGVGLRKIDWDDLPSGSGDVTGPASSTNNTIAIFDGSTGKVIKEGTNWTINPTTRTLEGGSLSELQTPRVLATSDIKTDVITEWTFAAGVTIDGVLIKDTAISLDSGTTTISATEFNLLDGMTSKTGTDTNFVTGTAGTDQNLIEWDANGDAIDSGIAAADVITNTDTATTTTAGISELATDAEATALSATDRVLTPSNAAAILADPGAIGGTDPVTRFDYDKAVGTVVSGGNLGATETINFNSGTHFTGTLDSNITFTFSNATSGQNVTLYLSYDGTAQRTITWPTITWLDNSSGAAPATPAASGNVLVVTVQYIGTTYYGSATGNYAVYS